MVIVFSNIFYDANKKLPIVIDPRGSLNDRDFSNAGPIIYDVAKLNHSINGLYDQIISKRYFLDYSDNLASINFHLPYLNETKLTQDYFLQQINERFGINHQLVTCWTSLLFFTMLPLHADDKRKQLALFANGLRMYQLMCDM